MNGKQCKKLRRLAEMATVGKPTRRLGVQKNNPGTLLNDPESTRGAYRTLKKAYKEGRLPDAIRRA